MGIVKSAVYRHYESKEEIIHAVFQMMVTYYDEHFGSPTHLDPLPRTTDELLTMTMRMVHFTVYDPKVVKIRKIILTEQFRDEDISQFATRYFIEDTRSIFKKFFLHLMASGAIKQTNVDFLAFSFTAPITALIHLCDRSPEKTPGALAEIEQFTRQFIAVYGINQ